MTISHDANTRFPTTDTTGFDTTTGDRTFSHAGSASAKAAVVVVCNQTVSTAVVTGVTYGGVAMTLIEARTDTTEVGRVEVYVLADQASFPTGTVDVVLQGCTASNKWATCSTMTASVGSRIKVNTQNGVDTTVSTNPTVTLTTTATTILYGAVHGGAAAPTSYAATGSETVQHNADYGALSARTARYTSETAAGTPAFGFTFATSDDWCIAAVALEEYTPPPVGDPYQRDPRWYRANIFFRPSAEPVQWLGSTEQPSTATAEIGSSAMAPSVTATEAKVAVQTGSCGIAASGAATGQKVSVQIATAAAAAVGTGLESQGTQVEAELGTGAVAPATTATERKVAVQTGTSSLAAVGTATGGAVAAVDPNQARPQIAVMFLDPWGAAFQLQGDSAGVTAQVEAQTGTSSAAPAASATERKVAAQTGQSSIAPAGAAADAKNAAETGTGSLAAAGTHTGGAVRAQTGVCGLGAAGSGASRKVAASRGTSSTAPTGTAASAKRAATIGRCTAAPVGTHSGVISRAQTGTCGFGAIGTATARKIAGGHQGHAAIAPAARGTNTKRATGHVGSSCLAPAGTGLQTRRAGQLGTATVAVIQTWTAAVPDPNPLRITFTERSTTITKTERASHTFTDPDTGIIYQEGED